jgi:hypothetical protein
VKAPLPLQEKEGLIAEQWEGEGASPLAILPLTLPPLRGSFPLPQGERGS